MQYTRNLKLQEENWKENERERQVGEFLIHNQCQRHWDASMRNRLKKEGI